MNQTTIQESPATFTSTNLDEVRRFDLFVDADGKHWYVHHAFKHVVVLRGSGKIEGMERRIQRRELASYTKAEIPAAVKRGQVLSCDGSRCVVNGFRRPAFVMLRGTWGSKDGGEQDTAFPMSREYFAVYGVRLLFPAEIEPCEAVVNPAALQPV